MPEEEGMLRVLSSDTRRQIIKELSNGYRTPSDLSKILKKSKSTTVEHLEKLVETGIVSKSITPGRKWVFYSLTKKGQSMVPSRSNSIIFVLAVTMLSLTIGSLYMYKYFTQPLILIETVNYEGEMEIRETVPAGSAPLKQGSDEVNTTETKNKSFLLLSAVLLLAAIAGMGTFVYMRSSQGKPTHL